MKGKKHTNQKRKNKTIFRHDSLCKEFRETYKTFLELNNESNNIVGFKISREKSTEFLYLTMNKVKPKLKLCHLYLLKKGEMFRYKSKKIGIRSV